MKKLLLAVLSCSLLASCSKKTDTYYTSSVPAYTISGIQNLTLQNGVDATENVALFLTVQYQDSNQQTVSLSVSGLPQGITASDTITGIPTYTTTMLFSDTSTTAPAAPGTYPITITASSSSSPQKTYTFNLTVLATRLYAPSIVGSYTHCTSPCSINPGTVYADSIYNDTTVPNKIYFHNFMNTGQTVYATVNGYSQSSDALISIPQQTVSGYNFSATTTLYYAPTTSLVFSDVSYVAPNGTNHSLCYLNMTR